MKFLVIRFSSLGDIILLSSVFREIKKIYPLSKITFMTADSFTQLYNENPYIDRIYAFNKKNGFLAIKNARAFIRKEKFDIIFDAHRSLRSFLICLFQSCRIFKNHKRIFSRYGLIHYKIKPRKIVSQREAYLLWLKKLTKKKVDTKSEFFFNKSAENEITALTKKFSLKKKSFVVIAIGARYFNKCWLYENWYSLIQKMKEKKIFVILIGTEQDKKIFPSYEKIAKNCHLDLTGKLSVKESAVLLQQALVLICGDSAPLHLAESVGTPVISIFGPTTADFGFSPFLKNSILFDKKLECKPCSAHGKKKCINKIEKKCMHDVSVVEVWEALKNFISL